MRKHAKRYSPEFNMRTPGERWHEEVKLEGFFKPLITFLSTMFVIIMGVIFLGGAVEPQKAEGAPIVFTDLKEPVFVMEEQEVNDDAEIFGDPGISMPGTEEPLYLPEEPAPIDPVLENSYVYSEPEWYEYEYSEPEWYEPPCSYPVSQEPGSLKMNGVETDGVYTYTWYSQQVLPGGGLDIPGRHVSEEGYVQDGEGNIVVASSDLPRGTVVETPYGQAKVYDTGCASGILDVYTNW